MKYKKTRSNFSIFMRILFLILVFAGMIYGINLLFHPKNEDKISDEGLKTKVIDLEHATVDNKVGEEKEQQPDEKSESTQSQDTEIENVKAQEAKGEDAKTEKNKSEDTKIEDVKTEEVKSEDTKATEGKREGEKSQGGKTQDGKVENKGTKTESEKPQATGNSNFTLSPRFDAEVANRFSYVKNEPDSIHVMLNKKNALPDGFKTQNLVVPDIKFPFTHDTPKKYMRKEAAEALARLCADAQADGHTIYGISGYRSYETQKNLYNMYVNRDGQESADKYSSKPGHSEHQSGLVMDVSSKDGKFDLLESFGDLPEGKWIAENSHKYGFIVRYLKDKVDITGYAYEPWHLRYVGEEVATYMYENNLCFEEFYDIIGVPYNK